MASARWILHADMDAFYASIEQRDHPELRGKPVIVGATSARGVVAAASYEAREFGVRSAMPGFRARELCPHGVFLAGNMEHYAAVSAAVHAVFEAFTPLIEPIALDEAFLDISGSVGLFGGPRVLAEQLKARVLEETGLIVSVGVAPNKLVAKLACTLSKPDGLKVVAAEEIAALLSPLPVRRLWGVGPVLEQELLALKIHTVLDLAQYDARALRNALGDRAVELQLMASGRDDREVYVDRAPKSYGEENTFETDVLDRDTVSGALTAHAEAIARRLRSDSYAGRTVTLKIKLGKARGQRIARGKNDGLEPRYPLLTRSKTLRVATNDGSLIRQVALALWDAAQVREAVRLLGVSVSNLTEDRSKQLDLFENRPKKDALGPTLDKIRQRFGKDAVFRASGKAVKQAPTLHKKRGE